MGKSGRRTQRRQDNRDLPQLLQELNVKHWDYLVVSDGSGTVMNNPCGWCGILISNDATWARRHFYGGMSTGTNIVAELMGVIHPLLWLSRQKGRKYPLAVHVLTDCEVLRNTARQSTSKRTNKSLWYFFGALQRELGAITFHWLPRETTALNQFADRAAKKGRKQMIDFPTEIELVKTIATEAVSLDDLNPW